MKDKLYSVTYQSSDKDGVIIKGIIILATTEMDAIKKTDELRYTDRIFSAIEVEHLKLSKTKNLTK